jgi:hypothetical protein
MYWTKVKNQRAFQAVFGLQAAPMLEFCQFTLVNP